MPPTMEDPHGIDCIGRALADQLHIGHQKTRLVHRRKKGHGHAVPGRRPSGRFMGRQIVGNEKDPIKGHGIHSGAGNRKMTIMDGVKGPAHDA